jgi:Sugar (and other) transporter
MAHVLLVWRNQLLGTSLCRSLCSWAWYRPQKYHRPCVLGRMCSCQYPRCPGNDVADVDRFWNHAWMCELLCALPSCAILTNVSPADVMSLAFYHVKDTHNITGLSWRLMLGSAGFPAIIVMAQVYLLPESPRWLMKKGRYEEAFNSLLRLRNSKLQAARDLYCRAFLTCHPVNVLTPYPTKDIHVLLEEEKLVTRNRNLALELFTVPRNRRAALASFIVMYMQQFCGVNVSNGCRSMI